MRKKSPLNWSKFIDASRLGRIAIMGNGADLNTPYNLTDDSLQHYRDHGWVLLRSVCSEDEVDEFGPLITESAIRHCTETRPMEERDTYGKAFLQIMNLWRLDPEVAAYTMAKRFSGIAAKLIGVEKVRLYHDQALFKEPGGGHTPWHQDGYFWPLDQAKTVTMWMPLVDIDATMGSMSFADGSHSMGVIPLESGISDDSEAFYDQYVREQGMVVRTSGPMKAGDATFHSGLTLHKAPGNPTDRIRAVMTVIYMADDVKVTEPQNPNQEADLATWFPGLKPGDLAASEINPLL